VLRSYSSVMTHSLLAAVLIARSLRGGRFPIYLPESRPLIGGEVAMKIFASVFECFCRRRTLSMSSRRRSRRMIPWRNIQRKWVETRKRPARQNLQNRRNRGWEQRYTIDIRRGTLIHQHTGDFGSKKTEQVLIFTYRNLNRHRGTGNGTVEKDPVSYLYQIKGEKMVLYVRVTNDDNNPVHGGVYERVKETPAKRNISGDSKQLPFSGSERQETRNQFESVRCMPDEIPDGAKVEKRPDRPSPVGRRGGSENGGPSKLPTRPPTPEISNR